MPRKREGESPGTTGRNKKKQKVQSAELSGTEEGAKTANPKAKAADAVKTKAAEATKSKAAKEAHAVAMEKTAKEKGKPLSSANP
jgi:hypothetical protein